MPPPDEGRGVPVLRQGRTPGGHLPISAKRSGSSVGLGVLAGLTTSPTKLSEHSRLLFPASVTCGQTVLPLQALIDSGVEDNLLDLDVGTQLGCNLDKLNQPIPAVALDGNVFTQITLQTSIVTLSF